MKSHFTQELLAPGRGAGEDDFRGVEHGAEIMTREERGGKSEERRGNSD
jgi:hypothetical protein